MVGTLTGRSWGWLRVAALLAALTMAVGGMAAVALAASPAQAAATVAVRTDATLGRILTDTAGKTLYHFDKDTAGVSNCNGGCATVWPAFSASAPLTLPAGVGGTLALITRSDGHPQATYNGEPLYYYAADTAAGDTMGQGIAGVWHVVAPTAVAASAAPTAAATTAPVATPAPARSTGTTTTVATPAQIPSKAPSTGAGGLTMSGLTALPLVAVLALGLVAVGWIGRRRAA